MITFIIKVAHSWPFISSYRGPRNTTRPAQQVCPTLSSSRPSSELLLLVHDLEPINPTYTASFDVDFDTLQRSEPDSLTCPDTVLMRSSSSW